MSSKKQEPPFNSGAAVYDSFTFLRSPAELTAAKAELMPGQNILDAACGSGWAAMAAARIVGETGYVAGVDIADKLLDVATRKTADSGITNIEYFTGDVHNLAFDDNSFNAVICASSLFLFEDCCRALAECHRVLKKGGRMVFSAFGEGIFQPVMKMLEDRLPSLDDKILRDSAVSRTDSPEKCRDIFKGAGFGEVEINEENPGVVFPDANECWRQISNSLIARPGLARLAASDREKLKTEILPELEKLCGSRGISVDVPLIFCTVVKL